MQKHISIQGARHNSLKDISLKIPRNEFVVITGVSGSGKSSLAFDTLYAEGRKRLLDGFSPYERQHIRKMEEADVDSIEGLSTIIAIDQNNVSRNPRSTVGTMTNINDYIRLLFSRASTANCPICQKEIPAIKENQIIARLFDFCDGANIKILVPTNNAKQDDFTEIASVNVSNNNRKQLVNALTKAFDLGEGTICIKSDNCDMNTYFNGIGCTDCSIVVKQLSAADFSFNSPYGACSTCTGIGIQYKIDPDLLIPDKTKSLSQGAIRLIDFKLSKDKFLNNRVLFEGLAEHYKFSLNTPVKDLPSDIIDIIMNGTNGEKFIVKRAEGFEPTMKTFEGLINHVKRVSGKRKSSIQNMTQYEDTDVTSSCICPDCNGAKVKSSRLKYVIDRKNIFDLCNMSISDLLSFFKHITLTDKKVYFGKPILKELTKRLENLNELGLGYLSLSRETRTLSGGELQRIRLVTQLDTGLIEMIYILDEPSIGLHSKDTIKMIHILKKLRDYGNTVIVVEHDEDIIRSADYIIDMGPGSGIHGGNVVAQGNIHDIINSNSLTGLYLSGRNKIKQPVRRRTGTGQFIEILNARENNLKNLDLKIPLGELICITGVSGSGKSTLVHKIIYSNISNLIHDSNEEHGLCDNVNGSEFISNIIHIDQSPIGRNSRSNIATYIGVFDIIRKLFANTIKAKENGYGVSRFSFNEIGGRCEECTGLGTITTQMHFMPDIEVICESCNGKRYNSDTLDVLYKGKNIAEVLGMTIDEAYDFFPDNLFISGQLKFMRDIGMGYIKLGQPVPTLSGGEAQRVKLCFYLSQALQEQHNLYILDEPTTGLHFADIEKLIVMLHKLVDKGNTVIAVEHNMDFISTVDHIIDLGPEGGENGGYIIAQGTPEEIVSYPDSYTGQYLKTKLNRNFL